VCRVCVDLVTIRPLRLSPRPGSAEDDRDRAVVHELDGHSRAEGAALDRNAELQERLTEARVERLRSCVRRRAGEARPAPLRRVLLLSQVNRRLEQRGLTVVSFPQTESRMIPASQRVYDAVTEQRLVHADDAQLNLHVHNAIARHSRRGWRIDRADANIDAVIDLCMAVGRAAYKPEPARLLGWI
jgi:hypothetical protein